MKINFKGVLDKRQKIILVLILISLVVLIWQIRDFMGDSNVSSTSSKPAHSPVVSNPPTQQSSSLSSAASIISSNQNKSNSADEAVQQKYLALVNQYQLVEVEKMIAQDEASIAQSRAQAAEALAKASQISGQSQNLAWDAVNNNHSGELNSSDYELIYTGQENSQWTATLKKQGQFNDVTAGTHLSDGTEILAVNDNGVTLEQNGVKKLLTFNGVTVIDQKTDQKQAEKLVKPKQKTIETASKKSALPVPANLGMTKSTKKVYTGPSQNQLSGGDEDDEDGDKNNASN